MDKIEILIPTYNRPEGLAITLTSLIYQSYRNFSIIISDQSDSEETLDEPYLLTVFRILEAHKIEVKVLRHLPRQGMAEQRQFLLDQSLSRYVLNLDDDVILERNVLKNLAITLKGERCGFVGASVIGLSYLNVVRVYEEKIEYWQNHVKPEKVIPGSKKWQRYKLHSGANLYHIEQKLPQKRIKKYKVSWISGCVLYDRSKLIDVGGFNLWGKLPQFSVGEDVETQLRLMEKYGGCGILPSGVYHQELPTTLPIRLVNTPEFFQHY